MRHELGSLGVWLRLVLLSGSLAAQSGCAKDPHAVGKTVPVAGKVTLNDQPLATGQVVFSPDAAKGNTCKHEPRGPIDAQGNYKLTSAGQAGAPLGWYRVTVIATEPFDPSKPYVIPKSHIPLEYNDAQTSGLVIEVKESPAPGVYDLKLKP